MHYGDLANVGIIVENLNPFLVQRIKKLCRDVKDKFIDNTSHDMLRQFHRRLESYDVNFMIPEDLAKDIEAEARKLIDGHEKKYQYFSRLFNFATLLPDGNVNFELERLWINVQRKGEFLPVHNHSGIFSFVIWADVPFSIEEETDHCPNPTTIKNRSGYFQFLYTDALGKITTLDLPVDKKWEGRMCLFPSELHHQVYPFYSSDDVRISIAGNFRVNPR